MGYTTRIDVQLRSVGGVATASAGSPRRSAGAESFTDLDVLGLTISGGYRVESAIVDCKTTAKGSTGRMFWVRGVADLFAADAAYMLRETDVSHAARQLANRLHITALNSKELAQAEAFHPSDLPLNSGPVSWLFDRDKTQKVLHAFSGLDGRLRELRDYREFDYWVGEEYRSLADCGAASLVQSIALAEKSSPCIPSDRFRLVVYRQPHARNRKHPKGVYKRSGPRVVTIHLRWPERFFREKRAVKDARASEPERCNSAGCLC